jgi:aspartyl/glutamyl-tRNA(Asn/Gln) amidotransferase C subunit
MSANNRDDESRISLEQVRHVALLAQLELDPAEEQSLQANMSEILTYIDRVNQLIPQIPHNHCYNRTGELRSYQQS